MKNKPSNSLSRIHELHLELAKLKKNLETSVEGSLVSLPEKMREVRKQLGYTQEQVAKQIGVTRCQYTNMEIGNSNVTVERLLRFCFALGVSADEILGLSKITSVEPK